MKIRSVLSETINDFRRMQKKSLEQIAEETNILLSKLVYINYKYDTIALEDNEIEPLANSIGCDSLYLHLAIAAQAGSLPWDTKRLETIVEVCRGEQW